MLTESLSRELPTDRATVGQSDSEIAATLGCSIWMVRQPQSYTAQEGDSDFCLS
jgi:hypothetical protein